MVVSRIIRVAGVCGLVISSVAVFATPAAASTPFPGENGRITFTKPVLGVPSVWTMQPDGSDKKLTAFRAHSAVWSPDGKRLAFVSGDDVHIANANGQARRNLTWDMRGDETMPQWSPNGESVAFVREEAKHDQQYSAIFSKNIYDFRAENISGWLGDGAGYRSPSWAPSSAQLVYERYGTGFRGLMIKDLGTSDARELVEISDPVQSSNASWSPSGKKVLYNDSDNAVYTVWPDGTHRTVISDGDSYSASWSPDGEKIAFLEDSHDDHISISEKDGTVVWLPIEKGNYEEISEPTWSPDGKKLIFTMSYGEGKDKETGLFSLNLTAENTTPTKLAQGQISELQWQVRN